HGTAKLGLAPGERLSPLSLGGFVQAHDRKGRRQLALTMRAAQRIAKRPRSERGPQDEIDAVLGGRIEKPDNRGRLARRAVLGLGVAGAAGRLICAWHMLNLMARAPPVNAVETAQSGSAAPRSLAGPGRALRPAFANEHAPLFQAAIARCIS